MAILFAEDFKGYGNQSALLTNGLWGSAGFNLIADPDPNAGGGYVAQFASFGNQGRRPFAKGALATAGMAFRMWMDNLPGFRVNVARFLDGGNGVQCAVEVTPTGVIEITHGGNPDHGGTVLATTAVPVLTANAYHHIEFKVFCDPAAGTAEVRVDGVSVLSVENVNTGSAYQIGLGTTNDYNGTAGVSAEIKDLVVWDATGDHNNNFLGTVSVVSMWPDADVSFGWTPSTGATGFNLINQAPPTDEVDYITAPYPPPPPSTFDLSNLPINVSSVRALITQVRARKSDGGDGNIQAALISAGDEIDGADRPMTTAFTYYEDVFEIDPATAAPWTPAGADAAEFKVNRTV